MSCGYVTAFGWTVLVIQVACTSDTTFSFGWGAQAETDLEWVCVGEGSARPFLLFLRSLDFLR